MKNQKRMGIAALALILGATTLDLGERLAIPGIVGYATSAEARVGRPLTATSVAGVGRRTVRRCEADVYDC